MKKQQPIDPELVSAFRLIPSLSTTSRWRLALTRALFKWVKLPSYSFHGVESVVDDGHLQHCLYQPKDKTLRNGGAVLWIHGGGLIMGTAAMSRTDCARIAQELGVTVLSVDYRLAPEYPYPAAIDDCYTAWHWLQREADVLGIDTRRIAIAGMSAGGGLAACLAQRLRDEGGVQPRGQVLIYPMLDDRTVLEAHLYRQQFRLWDNQSNRFAWRSYLSQVPGQNSIEPYAVAARCENLSGLPPVWLGVGDVDLFYSENKVYAQRLQDAQVACQWYEAKAAPHAFDVLAPGSKLARAFINDYMVFLRQALSL